MLLTMALSPAGRLVGAFVAGAAVIALVYGKGRVDGRQIAQQAVIERIERDNQEAGHAAERWRSDLRRCHDAGGVYDFTSSACQR